MNKTNEALRNVSLGEAVPFVVGGGGGGGDARVFVIPTSTPPNITRARRPLLISD